MRLFLFMNWFIWGIYQFPMCVIVCFLSQTDFVQYCKLSAHPCSWKWRFSICSDGWVYSSVSMDRFLFMSLLMDTLVDALSWRFNSAALEIGVQLSSSIMLFSGYKARGGLARSGSKFMFSVLRNVHTGFLVATRTHFLPRPQCRRIPCSPCSRSI